MDKYKRRVLLICDRNPDIKLDYVISITGQVENPDGVISSAIHLRYVPDKLILKPGSFGRYLDALGTLKSETLEERAAAILNDVNNELVSRWLQLSISGPDQLHHGITRHEVMLEDSQPNWDNVGLLSRLKLS